MICSEAQVIARGCQAVNTLHGMTSRIPQLMQQSHLESSEGKSPMTYYLPIALYFDVLTCSISVVGLLVTNPSSTYDTMYQLLS